MRFKKLPIRSQISQPKCRYFTNDSATFLQLMFGRAK